MSQDQHCSNDQSSWEPLHSIRMPVLDVHSSEIIRSRPSSASAAYRALSCSAAAHPTRHIQPDASQ